jgi:hypothetical protein
MLPGFKSLDVHSAIDGDDLTGGVTDVSAEHHCHGLGDVFRISPARLKGETLGDEFVVFILDHTGHLGHNDARTDLVDVDTEFSHTGREKTGEHCNAGFGNTIFAAVGADHSRRAASDVDDGSAFAFREVAAGELGEEEGSFEVDSGDEIKALFAHFQQVGAHFGGDAGVVDKGFKAAESCNDVIDQFLTVISFGDVATEIISFDLIFLLKFSALGFAVFHRLEVADSDVPSFGGEFLSDSGSDAASGTGDQGGFCHNNTSFRLLKKHCQL